MTNFNFLKQYLKLQDQDMYDQLLDLGFAELGYCRGDKLPYWNLALTNQLLTSGELKTLESHFTNWERKPSVYFEHAPRLQSLADLLTASGYKHNWEDSWQFWEGNPPPPSKIVVKKVNTLEDLQVFLDTFDQCYRKDDPLNPYGELGNYLQLSRESWLKLHAGNREEYFMAFKDNKPVSVATLDNYSGIGYICNVGSLMEVRGQGYGKAVTLHCVNESFKHGNTLHCLATEEGTYPDEFYKRLGFKTKFTAVGYTKE